MTFFPINCITDEEKHEFLRKNQKELASKADKELVGEEEEERVPFLNQLFNDLNERGNVYFQRTADESQLQKWEDHEATLNKATEKEIIIKPKEYNFDNKELNLSGYQELEIVYACGVGLEKAWFTDLPKLNNLYLWLQ